MLSARTEPALRELARRLHDAVADESLDLARTGLALATTRARFDSRAVVLAADRAELRAGLSELAEHGLAADLTSRATTTAPVRVVFAFPGQGSQWPGMAAALYAQSTVFRDHIHACADALAPHTDWSLVDVVRDLPGAASLDRVDVVQPALFAVMTSLAALWRSAGVRPDAVIGHSQGEIAAAHVAGALSLADAARIVALRSRALVELAGAGAMASVALPAADVAPLLADMPGSLAVAAVNGPGATVVSGDPAAVDALLARCAADGIRARAIAVDYASHSPQVDLLRDRLARELADVRPRSGEVAFYSTVTAGLFDPPGLDGDYWFRNLREPVRLTETVKALHDDGHRLVIEISPHPVLAPGLVETFDSLEEVRRPGAAGRPTVTAATGREPVGGTVLTTLRREAGDWDRFLTCLAEAHLHGLAVDWRPAFPPVTPAPVDLPTYPFQRRRYWIDTPPASVDAAAIGVGDADHPLLGAVVEVAGERGLVATGRLSPRTLPWLVDHGVGDTVLLPATGFLELAGYVGERAGLRQLVELTLHAPLVIPDDADVRVQVVLDPPGEDGRRAVSIHARREEDDTLATGAPWTLHASGLLAEDPSAPDAPVAADWAGAEPDGAWPPPAAVALTDGDPYALLADHGYHYGPAFQGLHAAWRLGDDLFADVRLPEPERSNASAYLLHPALLDAALHPMVLRQLPRRAGTDDGNATDRRIQLPFSWRDVRISGQAPTHVRVRLTPAGPDTVELTVADATGAVVAHAGALITRPTDLDRLAGSGDTLHRVVFTPAGPDEAAAPAGPVAVVSDDHGPLAANLRAAGVEAQVHPGLGELWSAVGAGAPEPPWVLVDLTAAASAPATDDGTRALLHRTLALAQAWLAADSTPPGASTAAHDSPPAGDHPNDDEGAPVRAPAAGGRLAFVTRGALAVPPDDDAPDPAAAAVWGLVRTAQLEEPDRFALLDVDGHPDSAAAIPRVLAGGAAQAAIRAGRALLPRLARVAAAPARDAAFPRDRTVLLTGGTGTLGAEVARHLVGAHGVRHLLLASRQGDASPSAAALVAELTARGADVRVAACDVGDRAATASLLASVDPTHPLGAVIHAAGVLDDGLLSALTPPRLDGVLRPKLAAARHLDELTRDLDLTAFVLFSSAAGTLGSPGQAGYAAANAALDALAARRRAAGRPAVSLAWGLWAPASGLTAELTTVDRARLGRLGMAPMAPAQALALFDAALDGTEPAVLAARLDLARLRRQAEQGEVHPLHRGLVTATRRRARAAHASRPAPDADPGGAGGLAARLAALDPAGRAALLLELVSRHIATVLGHDDVDAAAVAADRGLLDLGFDSLTAVELRNRLGATTGLRLPTTLVFDYPTPAAIARHLLAELTPDPPTPGDPLSELDRLEAALSAGGDPDDERHARVATRLADLLRAWNDRREPAPPDPNNDLATATDDELFDALDRELSTDGGPDASQLAWEG
ncbi:Narbonolide/10-deoxymethynolide synthase PikA1, modules 1 and 2 (fragment) [Frankia canadensis]|uniref:Narbonolide/10-deoxymethynolide synthase PikA1, modules 1 and 2 n=1 Tax=Frankia canadensis TaxID=1836972 RepID=A0A2I2KS93_9ACTN